MTSAVDFVFEEDIPEAPKSPGPMASQSTMPTGNLNT